ncbi:MAG: hypothetical protein ATN33_08510 [Epulopiscium sp. Nele67-Bin001]|nr:MAG: hypothetical protein BEN18_05555 [Epulopiscium sp. Nuni2H_MBin001]OON91794.1 MAG: hypothetical protein ATN33_08510 [Epulopiscium sp. Nele67-Bin001]
MQNPYEKLNAKVVSIDLIEPNINQPRKKFLDEELRELMMSIKEKGIIQPILVTQKGERFQIVAGERRFRAARMAALKEIPIIIKELTEQSEYEIALIENIHRTDLNVMELAKAYQTLIEQFGLTSDEIAVKIGKSRSYVANIVRLNQLTDYAQEKVFQNMISFGHARAILSVKDKNLQNSLVDEVILQNMTVRDIERRVKLLDRNSSRKVEASSAKLSPFYMEAQESLQSMLGTKVNIVSGKKRGKIEIEYYSDEELERIIEIIKV